MSYTRPDSIPFSAIIEGKRARQKKNYGDLSGIAESMKSVGTLNPIGLDRRKAETPEEQRVAHEGYVYVLIHGGRRYATMRTKIKPDFLYHGSIMDPEKLGFLYADEVPEDKRLEAELDENIHRLDFEWIDAALLIAEVHAAKRRIAQKDGKRWGLQQTGKLLKQSGANVQYAVKVAKFIKNGDKEILAQESLQDALNVLLKREEDAALAALQEKNAAALAQRKTQIVSGTSSFLDTINISFAPTPPKTESGALDSVLNLLTPKNGASASGGANKPSIQPASQRGASANPSALAGHPSKPAESPLSAPIEIPLSTLFFLGDSVDGDDPVLSRFSDASVDHIVTDIPYGIDMNNLDSKHVEDVADQHDVEQNVSMMPKFLAHAYRVIKPGGFCVFFYDLDHHEKLQAWATEVGFKVQRWPLIANKTSSCRNGAAAFNFTKNFEVAMVLRRDESSVLRKQQPTCVWTGDFAAERKLYNNPFAKPFELWKWIYEAIAFPGQTILDPYCGEMSACRAAINCGMTAMGIEKVPLHFTRGIEHIKSVYALIHRNNVNFT
jgi:DNA modification methylase/ParB-like chromosome segregation protein Spo0J